MVGVACEIITAQWWWASWVVIWGGSGLTTFHVQKLTPDDIKDLNLKNYN